MCIGDLHTEKEIFMSSTYVVIVLCIVVALLILMVGKLKFHAILALLIATITLGILVGTPLEKIPSTLNSGLEVPVPVLLWSSSSAHCSVLF